MQNNLFSSYRNVSVEYGGVVCVYMCVARVCVFVTITTTGIYIHKLLHFASHFMSHLFSFQLYFCF